MRTNLWTGKTHTYFCMIIFEIHKCQKQKHDDLFLCKPHLQTHHLFVRVQNINIRTGRTKFKARFISRTQTVKLQRSVKMLRTNDKLYSQAHSRLQHSPLYSPLWNTHRDVTFEMPPPHTAWAASSSSSMMERRASRPSMDTVRVPTTSLLSSTSSTANTHTHTHTCTMIIQWMILGFS